MAEVTFQVDGMSCAACVGRVEKALDALPFVTKSSVNLAGEKAAFQINQAPQGIEAAQALAQAGYPVVTDQIEVQFEALPDAGAAAQIERVLRALTGVLDLRLNLTTERATITFAAGAIAVSDITKALTTTGYGAELITGAHLDLDARKAKAARDLGRLTLLSAVLTLPIFAAEMGGHLVPRFHHWLNAVIGLEQLHIAEFALTLLILLVPGRRFFSKGLPQLFRGTPDMNSLVSVGTLAAFFYSTLAVFTPHIFPPNTANVYFESAAVIITLLLFGRFMEARAKGRTGEAIRALTALAPATAIVERDGRQVDLPLDQIRIGDVIVVRPGTSIAVDAEVIEGTSFVNEAMITGEAVPLEKSKGDEVIAGTLNGEGALRARALRVGADTMLAQIIRLVDQAQSDKLPIQSLVDKITAVFVPVVMGIALLTVAVWLMFGPEPALPFALVAGVAVLIIACPCAMGLATPTSIMVGTGRAAEMGVLFRQGAALQSLASVKTIAFDKTGTLTKGAPTLTDFEVLDGRDADTILAIVAGVESQSEHPIARAVVDEALRRGLTLPSPSNLRAVAGFGVKAEVNGAEILVGAARMMAREDLPLGAFQAKAESFAKAGKTPVFVAIEGVVSAVFAVQDPIKFNAPGAIKALHRHGVKTVMLTGDTRETALAIATALGIEDVRAELLPRAKIKAIEALQAEEGHVAFVGDGINDAPALAGADVGIAIGTGTDVAIGAADVVLVSGDISGVVTAIGLSQATLRNIRQNLFWAFAYNIVLIPVAAGLFYPVAGVLLSPMLGAFAMAMSSVFVLSNALRLRYVSV
ncbi:MAG: heavy metal translocating P-type ATPase [Maritimibacter sp.]